MPNNVMVTRRSEIRVGTAFKGYLLVIGAACGWATVGVLVKQIRLNYAPTPITLAFWRDFLTFVVMITALGLFDRSLLRVKREDLLPLAGLGVICVGLFHVLVIYAVDLIGVAPAHVFNYTAPAFVVLLSWCLWREPITRRKLAALALTFAGSVFVVKGYDWSQFRLNGVGMLVGLGTGITWAAYAILSKLYLERYNPFTLVTYAFGLAAITLLLPQPLRTLSFPWSQPAHLWLWLGLLVLVPSVAGFSLYTWALSYLSPSAAIITATVETVLAAMLAFLAFGDVLAPLQVLGAGLVLCGVVMLSAQERYTGIREAEGQRRRGV